MRLSTLLLTAAIFLSSFRAQACRCAGPVTIEKSYHAPVAKHFVRARVLSVKEPPTSFGVRRYTLKIQKNFKGCPRKGLVEVRTRVQSSACGLTLKIGRSYVMPLRNAKRPSINSCDFVRVFSTLTGKEKSFLRTREICCGRRCRCQRAASRVFCFRDPCSPPETCAIKGAKCVSNFCGGCFAEWFDADGLPVCREDSDLLGSSA